MTIDINQLQYFKAQPIESDRGIRRVKYAMKIKKVRNGAYKMVFSRQALLELDLSQTERRVQICSYKNRLVVFRTDDADSCLITSQGMGGVIYQSRLTKEIYDYVMEKKEFSLDDMESITVIDGEKEYHGISLKF